MRLDFVLSDARADLIAEQIDLAFRAGALRDSGCLGRQLVGSSSDGLVASPDYIAARGAPGTLQDLVNHDCVTPAHPGGRALWRLSGPDGVEEVFVSGRFSGNTAQALRKATVVGLGIALLPQMMTRLDVRAGGLVPVLPHHRHARPGLSVLDPSRRQLPLAVSAFIDFVTERLGAVEANAVGA